MLRHLLLLLPRLSSEGSCRLTCSTNKVLPMRAPMFLTMEVPIRSTLGPSTRHPTSGGPTAAPKVPRDIPSSSRSRTKWVPQALSMNRSLPTGWPQVCGSMAYRDLNRWDPGVLPHRTCITRGIVCIPTSNTQAIITPRRHTNITCDRDTRTGTTRCTTNRTTVRNSPTLHTTSSAIPPSRRTNNNNSRSCSIHRFFLASR